MSAPWITLGLGVGAFLLVLHALRPVRRPSPFQVFGLFASWILIELPLHVLVLVIFEAWVCVNYGGLDAWPGWVGLGGFGAAIIGLVHLTHRSFQVAEHVEKALVEVPPPPAAKFPYRRARLWIPTSHFQPAVKVDLDVPYTDTGAKRHLLDVYRPHSISGPSPVILQLHGGGWMIGHKRQQGRPLLTHLAANGFVCVAANYHLSPKATFPDHIIDVKRAIAWVRAHIADYGGNPDFIAVTGGSAGAHLATLAALTPNVPDWQPGFEAADTRVQACVPLYGVYDFTNRDGSFPSRGVEHMLTRFIIKQNLAQARQLYASASPLDRLTPHAPPFFVIHGAHDSLAPIEQCRTFVDALGTISTSRVSFLELPIAQHAFDVFPSIRVRSVLEGIRHFLLATYSVAGGEQRAGRQLGPEEAGVGVNDQTDGNRL